MVGKAAVTALIAVAVVFLAFALQDRLSDSGDSSSESAPSVSIRGLFPPFDPSETRYVSRCGRGGPLVAGRTGAGSRVAIGASRPRAGAFRIARDRVGPGYDFVLGVYSGDRSRRYRVRCLPADFPAWRFQRLRRLGSGLFVVAFRADPRTRPWIIVFDHRGVPRWWFSPSTRVLWAQILKDGTVAWARSFGDGFGLDPRMAIELRTPAARLLELARTRGLITDGHEFRELANGNVLMSSYAPAGGVNLRRFGGPPRTAAAFAEVQEVDPRGRVVWRWNSRGRIRLGETGRWWRNVLANSKSTGTRPTIFDPVHINSIEPRGPDELVISTRHTDAVYGIDRSTGEISWKLGGLETPQSLRILGDPARKSFGGQHDARIGEDGILSIYDNAKDRPRRPRAAFYRLHVGRGVATYLGQINDRKIKTSHCCGSVRPLAGGGWLVSWGDNPLVTGFDRDKRIAFRLSLPTSTYRAVPVPPGATSIADLDRGLEAMERHRATARPQ